MYVYLVCTYVCMQGCALGWESYKLEGYVAKFSDFVFSFQEKVCTHTHTHTRTHELIMTTVHVPYFLE